VIDAALSSEAPPSLSAAWLSGQIASSDLRVHTLRAGSVAAEVIYLATLTDPQRVSDEVVEPVARSALDLRAALPRASVTRVPEEALERIVAGYAVVLVGAGEAVCVDVARRPTRNVTKPGATTVLPGPRNGFVEDVDVNIGLVRSILPLVGLRVEETALGASRTRAVLMHLDGRASPERVLRVRAALDSVRTGPVLSDLTVAARTFQSGYTPFPLSVRTERPDVVAELLFRGRVAVMVQGSPFSLVVPATLLDIEHAAEPRLGSPAIATFVRWVRLIGIGVGVLAPGAYTALLAVDPNVVPPLLLAAIAAAREGLPYPVLLETFLMLIVLDAITIAAEVSPGSLGQALTVVGSLIIGQAAVQARLTSTITVIVLSVVLIGNLLVQDLRVAYALRIVKYPLVLLAGIFGLVGLSAGVMLLAIHLVSLKSLDVPYLTFVAPTDLRTLAHDSLWTRPRTAR
jgi:hypothetical protein